MINFLKNKFYIKWAVGQPELLTNYSIIKNNDNTFSVIYESYDGPGDDFRYYININKYDMGGNIINYNYLDDIEHIFNIFLIDKNNSYICNTQTIDFKNNITYIDSNFNHKKIIDGKFLSITKCFDNNILILSDNNKLIKVNSNGEIISNNKLITPIFVNDQNLIIFEVTKNNFRVFKFNKTNINNNTNELYFLKINEEGDLDSEKKISEYVNLYGFYKTNDNNFITILNKNNEYNKDIDIYIIKIDLNGNIIWEKSYGTKFDDILISVDKTNNTGYILLSNSIIRNSENNNMNLHNVYLLKTNIEGDKLWSKIYRDDSLIEDKGNILYDSNGYFLIFKLNTNYNNENSKIYKFDIEGNIITDQNQ